MAVLALALVLPLSMATGTRTALGASPLSLTNEVITQQGRVMTSSAFSTTNNNELLVVFLSDDGNATPGETNTLTGAGLTWNLAKNQNTQPGAASIYWAIAATPLTNVTLTETRSQIKGLSGQMTIQGFTGEDLATPIAGAAGASGTTAAMSVTVTTVTTNSWVWGVGNDWTNNSAITVGGSQTFVDYWADPSQTNTFWSQKRTAATAAISSVTITDTGPAGDKWNLAAVAVQSATPGTSPVTVDSVHVATRANSGMRSITSDPISTSVTNQVLIAFITTNSNQSATPNPIGTVTSNGGLTWTKAAGISSRGNAAEVWWVAAPSVVSNISVVATSTGTNFESGAFIIVTAWTGVDATTPIGATNTGSAAASAPTLNVTTTRANSWVWAVGTTMTSGTAHTVGAAQTKHYEYNDTVSTDGYWIQNQTAATANSGTVVTTNDTAPTVDDWELAVVEIMPDPTMAAVSAAASVLGTGGLSWATAPGDLSFPSTALSATQQTASQGMALDISDLSGSGNGWNIQASGSQLTNGAHTLPQAGVTAGPTQVCDTAGQCTAATTNVTFPWTMTASPQKLFNATAGTGMGNGTVTPTFIATIPAYAFSGAYTATWVFSLSSGP